MKKQNKVGRPKDIKTIKLVQDLMINRGLSYRNTAAILEKKLGRKVNTKEIYRWRRYALDAPKPVEN